MTTWRITRYWLYIGHLGLSLAGLTMSVSDTVIGWRRLRRKLQRESG